MPLEQSIKGIYFQSVYLTAKSIQMFFILIEQFLIPALPENSVVVMDNAAFHKRADIQELLEQQGHKILWLPAYSPDLNPIEQMWAWVKRKRKEWLIDSVDELFRVFSNLV